MRSSVEQKPEPPLWLVRYAQRLPHVRAALVYAGGTHDEYDIAAGIEKGRFQMWCGPDSIAITELCESPKALDCHVFLAGGHLAELEEITQRIEEWAKQQGCQRVTLAGRKGWLRSFLRGRNYTPRWYVMAKDLEVCFGQGWQRDQAADDAGSQERDSGVGVSGGPK